MEGLSSYVLQSNYTTFAQSKSKQQVTVIQGIELIYFQNDGDLVLINP